jgi:hypothetical protein
MPYLSLSHYPDLDGSAVPGVVDALFIDGKFLKAKGRLFDNPLGSAVWGALKSDLEQKANTEYNPVRISIAFLDYEHKHKDTGFIFTRSFDSLDTMICPECVKNRKEGKRGGKVFLKGLLIHLALTRIPVNQRTLMELEEKSMTTRKQDAESIVGEELAAKIDEQAIAVGKSEADDALIVRNDDVEETQEQEMTLASLAEILTASFARLNDSIGALTEQVKAFPAKDKKDEDYQEKPDEEDDEEDEKKDKALVEESAAVAAVEQAFVSALTEMSTAITQRLDILIAANTQKPVADGGVPERRSMARDVTQVKNLAPGQNDLPAPGQPMKIEEYIKQQFLSGR